ncbi:MAG: CBS domain-containing protein [Candidatus Woesearchaeota archaeon]|nr:CBS domain-containing protein [Candidatus Woesearchaeota archaeon]
MKVENCDLIKPLGCTEDDTVQHVAQCLRDNKQRRSVIVNADGAPVGVVSTTDINNKVVAEGKDATQTKASEIMTSPIHVVCDMGDDVEGIYEQMVEKSSFFCPVTKEGKLHGVLTYGEIMAKAREHMA